MLPLVVNVVLICLYASVCLRCSVATVNKPKNNSLPAVIAFGDSFADSGNNNFRVTLAKANFYPYGKDFMGGKATGRFTNGKTLADTIAAKLGVMDYLPAYLDPSLQNEDMIRGVSFASGASGFDPLTGRLLNVFSIPDQIEMFKEYIVKLKGIVGEKETNDIIENGLYLVSWSSNDWGISYTALPIRAVQYDVPTYATFLVKKATEFIQRGTDSNELQFDSLQRH
ncbi:putative triacylglycerol lipase [Helianthus anomalus]